jgi:hypothetical protein
MIEAVIRRAEDADLAAIIRLRRQWTREQEGDRGDPAVPIGSSWINVRDRSSLDGLHGAELQPKLQPRTVSLESFVYSR